MHATLAVLVDKGKKEKGKKKKKKSIIIIIIVIIIIVKIQLELVVRWPNVSRELSRKGRKI